MKDVIIIPTYNEKKNIGKLLRIISSILPSTHILVVDDNSPDGTSEEVKKIKEEIPNLELLLRSNKEGLGKAYIDAFRKVLTDSDIRCLYTMDADFSHSPQFLLKIFQEIERFDVIIGSRYVKGGGIRGWPFWRKALSRLANLYAQIVLALPIKDCTSGFLCIKTSFLRKINLEEIRASGFAFLVELKYSLRKKGARFKEIPIIVENRKEGKSKITIGIVLEGIFTSLRLISKDSLKKIKNLRTIVRDVLKKRGIFFIIYQGPRVFYRTFLKRQNDLFSFQNKCYNYFYSVYNCTCLNERAVEVPIVWEFVKEYQGKKILEIGNVLSHYFTISHDVLDKYDKGEEIINQDVVDFRPSQKYDLIVSISTLEHVGWDEEPKEPEKILLAIDRLKECLAPEGRMIVTLPLGYNPKMDQLLSEGKIQFTNQYFLKRVSHNNNWQEVDKNEVLGIAYDYFNMTANGLVIGTVGNVF
ncbi:MAG: glycosyltransferase [Nanoarchaeota archaeon]|nr:glycosyltransferase [Nanoarchaeota archaeon]